MISMQDAAQVALVGVGATAMMDLWLLALRRLGVPTTDFALVGRWVGHVARGRFAHAAIARAAPVAGECLLGWLTHYAVGIAFAALLVAMQGLQWVHDPAFAPALAIGVVTVVMPLFVMQPAMGAGFAGAKTPSPLKSCVRSLANHTVFGAGLYLAGRCLAWAVR